MSNEVFLLYIYFYEAESVVGDVVSIEETCCRSKKHCSNVHVQRVSSKTVACLIFCNLKKLEPIFTIWHTAS